MLNSLQYTALVVSCVLLASGLISTQSPCETEIPKQSSTGNTSSTTNPESAAEDNNIPFPTMPFAYQYFAWAYRLSRSLALYSIPYVLFIQGKNSDGISCDSILLRVMHNMVMLCLVYCVYYLGPDSIVMSRAYEANIWDLVFVAHDWCLVCVVWICAITSAPRTESGITPFIAILLILIAIGAFVLSTCVVLEIISWNAFDPSQLVTVITIIAYVGMVSSRVSQLVHIWSRRNVDGWPHSFLCLELCASVFFLVVVFIKSVWGDAFVITVVYGILDVLMLCALHIQFLDFTRRGPDDDTTRKAQVNTIDVQTTAPTTPRGHQVKVPTHEIAVGGDIADIKSEDRILLPLDLPGHIETPTPPPARALGVKAQDIIQETTLPPLPVPIRKVQDEGVGTDYEPQPSPPPSHHTRYYDHHDTKGIQVTMNTTYPDTVLDYSQPIQPYAPPPPPYTSSSTFAHEVTAHRRFMSPIRRVLTPPFLISVDDLPPPPPPPPQTSVPAPPASRKHEAYTTPSTVLPSSSSEGRFQTSQHPLMPHRSPRRVRPAAPAMPTLKGTPPPLFRYPFRTES